MLSYDEAVTITTASGFTLEKAHEIVQSKCTITEEKLASSLKSVSSSKIERTIQEYKDSKTKTKFYDDTLANAKKILGVHFTKEYGGLTKQPDGKFRFDFNHKNFVTNNITKEYYLSLKDKHNCGEHSTTILTNKGQKFVTTYPFIKASDYDKLPDEIKPYKIKKIKNSKAKQSFRSHWFYKDGSRVNSLVIDMRKLAEFQNNTNNVLSITA
jgi:hypothetical protein